MGIIGLGRIGKRVGHFAEKAFEMKILYTDVKPNQEFEDKHGAVFYENVEELLPLCDYVSLHVPLLPTTRHLMNEKRLGLMKKSAYFVNTSRGAVVEEEALVKALADGEIRGAALDVFEFGPKISEELKKMDNVILTPHIASATDETREKMSKMAAENIIEALEGKTPPNLVKQ